MTAPRVYRRPAAIVAADLVGFSRLVDVDEEGTLARLKAMREELIDPVIAKAGGRIVKTMGDGLLIEFPSSVDAVRCAIELQTGLGQLDAGLPGDRRLDWRIGVHLGDVVVDGDDLLGDGINIAVRLEGIAAPGGIAIPKDIWRQGQGRVGVNFVDAGEQRLKNIAQPFRVFRHVLGDPGAAAMVRRTTPLPDKASIAVLPFRSSGGQEREAFADGLTESINTMLSKLGGLRMIARNSSFVY